MDKLSAAVVELDASNRELLGKWEAAASTRDGLRGRVEALTHAVVSRDDVIARLRQQVADLQAGYTVKTKDCAALAAEVARLTRMVEALQLARMPLSEGEGARGVIAALAEAQEAQAAAQDTARELMAREGEWAAQLAAWKSQAAGRVREHRAMGVAALVRALAAVTSRRAWRHKCRAFAAMRTHAREEAAGAVVSGCDARVAQVQLAAATAMACLRVRISGKAALAAWRAVAHRDAQEETATARAFHARVRLAQARGVFVAWVGASHRRAACRRLQGVADGVALRHGWAQWCRAVRVGLRDVAVGWQTAMRQARAAIHATTALHAWRLRARQRRRLRQAAHEVQARVSSRCCRQAWRGWRKQRGQAWGLRRLHALLQRQAQRVAMATWRRHAAGRVVAWAQQRAALALSKWQASSATALVATAFARWRAFVGHAVQHRALLTRVVSRWMHRHVTAAWNAWRAHVAVAGAMETVRASVATSFHARLHRRHMTRVFRYWVARAAHRRTLARCVHGFAGTIAPRLQVRMAVRVWHAAVRQRAHHATVVAAYNHRLLRAVVSAWRAHVQGTVAGDAARVHAYTSQRVSRHAMAALVRTCWSTWFAAARARRRMRAVLSRMMRTCAMGMLQRGFHAWRQAAGREAAAAASRATALRAAVRQWHSHAAARGVAAHTQRRLAGLASSWHVHRLRRRVWTMWSRAAHIRRLQRQALRTMGNLSATGRLRMAMAHWHRVAHGTVWWDQVHTAMSAHLTSTLARRRVEAALTRWRRAASATARAGAQHRLRMAQAVCLHTVCTLQRHRSHHVAATLASAFRHWRTVANACHDTAAQAAMVQAQRAVWLTTWQLQHTIVQHLCRVHTMAHLFSALHAVLRSHLPRWHACLWVLDPGRQRMWTLAEAAWKPASATGGGVSGRVKQAHGEGGRPLLPTLPPWPDIVPDGRAGVARPIPLGSATMGASSRRPSLQTATATWAGGDGRGGVGSAGVGGAGAHPMAHGDGDDDAASHATGDTAAIAAAGGEKVYAPFNTSLIGLAASRALSPMQAGGKEPDHAHAASPASTWTPEGWMIVPDAAKDAAYHATIDLGVQYALQAGGTPAAVPCVIIPCRTRATAAALANALDIRAVDADLRHAGAGDATAIAIHLYQPCAMLQIAMPVAPAPDGSAGGGEAGLARVFTEEEVSIMTTLSHAIGVAMDHLVHHANDRARLKLATASLSAARREVGAVHGSLDALSSHATAIARERDEASAALARAKATIADLENQIAALASVEKSAAAAKSMVSDLRGALTQRNEELAEARQAAAVLQLALEELMGEGGGAREWGVAQDIIAVREEEAATLRTALSVAHRDNAMVSAALDAVAHVVNAPGGATGVPEATTARLPLATAPPTSTVDVVESSARGRRSSVLSVFALG